jgi:hypothetical protein
MHRTNRFILMVVAISWLGVAPPIVERIETTPSASASPVVNLHDSDPRWIEDIGTDRRTLGRAGLDTFRVEVDVWPTAAGSDRCHGHAGLFSDATTGPGVDLCIDYISTDLGTHLRHKLILHELAHAWIHGNVSDSTRTEFMTLRGIDTWNDPRTAHPARGTEIAANTIMYALHPDAPANIDHLCGYELITGQPAPAGRPDPCAATVRSS